MFKPFIVSIISAIIVSVPIGILATTYYVATVGQDSNDGTASS